MSHRGEKSSSSHKLPHDLRGDIVSSEEEEIVEAKYHHRSSHRKKCDECEVDDPCDKSSSFGCYPGCYPKPCLPEFCCGSTYYCWEGECGRKYRSLLKSAVDPEALSRSLTTLSTRLQTLFNSHVSTPTSVAALGMLDNGSSVTSASATYFGIIEAATAFSILFNSFPLTTRGVVSILPQFLYGDIINVVTRITISTAIPTVISIAGTYKAINCGSGTPVIITVSLR